MIFLRRKENNFQIADQPKSISLYFLEITPNLIQRIGEMYEDLKTRLNKNKFSKFIDLCLCTLDRLLKFDEPQLHEETMRAISTFTNYDEKYLLTHKLFVSNLQLYIDYIKDQRENHLEIVRILGYTLHLRSAKIAKQLIKMGILEVLGEIIPDTDQAKRDMLWTLSNLADTSKSTATKLFDSDIFNDVVNYLSTESSPRILRYSLYVILHSLSHFDPESQMKFYEVYHEILERYPICLEKVDNDDIIHRLVQHLIDILSHFYKEDLQKELKPDEKLKDEFEIEEMIEHMAQSTNDFLSEIASIII